MRADWRRLKLSAAVTALLAVASLAVQAVGSEPAAASYGQTVFTTRGCSACHTTAGLAGGSIGPELTGLSDRAGQRVAGLSAEQYVRQSILEPQAFIVPGFGGQMPALRLTSEEVDAVVAFLLGN
jgi:mono/diheme cytochrome c family protein